MSLISNFYRTIFPKNFKILSSIETLNYIISNKVSISRFGDGEFSIINGSAGPSFQKFHPDLQQRLKEVLESNNKRILICIPQALKPEGRLYMEDFANKFWETQSKKLSYSILKRINNKTFGNSQITRPYMDNKKTDSNISYSKLIFDNLKNIWLNKRILIIEGTHSRLGIGNDLFNTSKSIHRILCPSENAWGIYDKIYHISSIYSPNFDLTLIALGPTATILAHDLGRKNIQALDIGHIDIEYEWFLRKATKKEQINNKYVNEIQRSIPKISQKSNHTLNYNNEIIERIDI